MPHHIRSPSSRPLLASGSNATLQSSDTRIEAERRSAGGILEHNHSVTVQGNQLQTQGSSGMNTYPVSQNQPFHHQEHQFHGRQDQQNIIERRVDDCLPTRIRSHSVEQHTHVSLDSVCSSRSSPRRVSHILSGNGIDELKAHDVRSLMTSEPNRRNSFDQQQQPVSNLQNKIYEEEKKENDDSQEKELVSGALLGLVSLASRVANGTEKTQVQAQSNKHLTDTPPPPQVQQSSTITPSNSVPDVLLMQKTNRSTSNSPNSTMNKSFVSCVSDGSDTQRMTMYLPSHESNSNYDAPRLPPRHPLCFQPTSNTNDAPSMLHQDVPRQQHPLPVPKLDRRSIDADPGYTLHMKKEIKGQFDSQDTYVHRPGPRYATRDAYEGNPVPPSQPSLGPRPMRHYSAPNGAPVMNDQHHHSRRVFYEHERRTPPMPYEVAHEAIPTMHGNRSFKRHMSEQIPRHRHHTSDVYGDTTRSIHHDPYSRHARDYQTASRDDIEERSQYYRAVDRQHAIDEAYYSPPYHYLPPQRRQHYGPSMQRSLQPFPRRNSVASHHHQYVHGPRDDRPQFKCPDGPPSRPPPQNAGPSNGPHLSPHPSVHSAHPHSPYHLSPYHHPKSQASIQNPEMIVKKTILRRKCAWKNYPELEKFLIENREEYLKHSAKNYTIEQKQYNNRLTERLLEVAAKHNYVFDPNDFNFVAVRDRIRCYYKSYVQSNKKRGVIVGYDASGMKKKQRCEEPSVEVAKEDSASGVENPTTNGEGEIVNLKDPTVIGNEGSSSSEQN